MIWGSSDALLEDTEEIDFRVRRMRVLKVETLVALKRPSEDPKDRHRETRLTSFGL